MTPEQLKASILQYAIQGKLVEQRLEEGSAEELYKQIQEEKQKLIKEGKIKKEKPLAGITEDEIPFDIPESWKWVRMGEIGDTNIGLTYKPTDKSSEGTIVLRSSNIQNGQMNYADIVKVECDIPDRAKIAKGDLLICARNGSRALVGKTAIVDRDGMAFGAFMAKFCSSINDYLIYFLQSPIFRNQLDGVKTETINQITQDTLRNQLLPLPPLEEQKRIIAKIEELLPFVDRYAEAYEKLEKFNTKFPEDMKKSILQYAIMGKLVEQRAEEGTAEDLYKSIQEEKQKLIKEGKIKKEKPLADIADDEIPFDIPDSWKWVRMGEIGDTNIGLTYKPTDKSSEGTIVLRSSNIQNGLMDYEDIVKVSCDIPDRAKIAKGDLLICARNGSRSLVGKAAIVDQDGMAFGAFMAKVCSSINDYLIYFLQSPIFRNQLDGVKTETINQITQDTLRNQLLPLPPRAEQERIIAKIEELLPYCEQLIK